ncbi:SAM-dependent methyltransferase [Pseudothauera rhizosphaerae]|uniref:SAM-dependent methyltransferase n=1 Tax=Pseudothauera rhizosphaerae TaxID=2565932 RepID=A0A4S4AQR6_9RHOO|nr:SAM-dependent methyltransferase [Pseudothauera rhizosphaerae]THF62037.1 SAM-dependent methyltransferase [Pseudothauera rhizosphaerae]
MQADFLDAHERHWDDAERLFAEGRYANADHLYGMAAECGLKRLMVRFGMAVNPVTGSPTDNKDWKHANNIWARFESYRSGKVEGNDYGLPTPSPFDNWDASDRYAHQSNFNQAGVQVHQAGAAAICELIKKAQREGLLV